MMYPFMTLNDETEIVHSEMLPNGRVKVYIEKPDAEDCFHHATCYLPEYEWTEVTGFTEEEMQKYKEIVESKIGSYWVYFWTNEKMKQSINEKRAENTFEKSLENAGAMMNYKGYIGKVEYDDENDIFTGSVINVRTVITFLGSTFDEIEKEFKASVDDYLNWCREDGAPAEKP